MNLEELKSRLSLLQDHPHEYSSRVKAIELLLLYIGDQEVNDLFEVL